MTAGRESSANLRGGGPGLDRGCPGPSQHAEAHRGRAQDADAQLEAWLCGSPRPSPDASEQHRGRRLVPSSPASWPPPSLWDRQEIRPLGHPAVRHRCRSAVRTASARCTACLRRGRHRQGTRAAHLSPPLRGWPAALTLGNALHVRLVGKEVLQPLHEQQSLVVALDAVLPTSRAADCTCSGEAGGSAQLPWQPRTGPGGPQDHLAHTSGACREGCWCHSEAQTGPRSPAPPAGQHRPK